MDTPPAEVDIDEELVRSLLIQQHPDLAHRELRLVANGWDNAILRLGDDLGVRMPRRAVAAVLVEHEQRWLPELRRRLSVDIPSPVRTGVPSETFPWPWSITPWFEGELASSLPVVSRGRLALDLAAFIRELHTTAPSDAPTNPVRGVALAARDESVQARLAYDSIPRREEVTALWNSCRDVDPWASAPVWLHGDLHPANILVRADRLTAVLDFGDITVGDPATDLAIAWLLFDAPTRERFREQLDYDDATWRRAVGWAVIFGTLALGGDGVFNSFGRFALEQVLLD